MRNTQRRVGRLTVEAGGGEGGSLALLVLPSGATDPAALGARLGAVAASDGVIRASLLQTDPALSTPLTAGAEPAPADAVAMVEASQPEVARAQAGVLAAELGLRADGVAVFQTLWRLGA